MARNKGSVDFTWLPSESELSSLQTLSASAEIQEFKPACEKLKSFLKRLFNLNVSIKDFKSKISHGKTEALPSLFYSQYLFNLTCIVDFDRELSDSTRAEVYKKLIIAFCSRKSEMNFPELYLTVDVPILIEDHLSTHDYFINLNCFSLGNIVKLNTFIEHFSSEYSLDSHKHKITQVKVKFLHDEEIFHVNFVVAVQKVRKPNGGTHRMHYLKIPYSTLHSILICHSDKFSVYFRLYKSPMLYAVQQDEEKDYVSYIDLDANTKWQRTVNLFQNCPPSIRKEFSMNSVLCLYFPKEDYEALKIMLRHKNIQVSFAPMNIVRYKPVQISLQINDFECYYAYQCLQTYSYELVDQLIDKQELVKFQELMKKYSATEEGCKILSQVLYKIHSAISKCHVVVLNYSINYLFEKLSTTVTSDSVEVESSVTKQENIIFVKRAIVIPTHVRFLPPQPILKSRALRSCNPDYSLRISLRDVNLETINFSYQGFADERKLFLKDFFMTYYMKQLLNGIKIQKRIYRYVGSSTSQLRGHGLWFYAEDSNGKTAQSLRKEFGELEKIKQVPKYMARMGQTFSQSRGGIKVPKKYTNVDNPDEDITGGIKIYLDEEDIDRPKGKFLKAEGELQMENQEEPYTFSDGIGRMSSEIAEEVYEKLNLEDRPVAMQIRYAGCKGMLVVDPNLKGKQILFRKSMKKFGSPDESLEILKVSEKRLASLNRPLITILEQLGVSKDVFVKLQKEMIQNHIKSMFYEPEACEFLKRNSKLRFNYLGMLTNGISFTEDPLFRSMIYALFQKQLALLKNKANIEIPPDKGRSMFGVIDETFTLEYGQVFIQYTKFDDSDRIIHEGTVVVTKNPCMHPGDVRKFEAVKVEALRHICDCIVFPAKGPRPHPDEMAGSDLDGDEYHVMWYEGFFFERDNVPAMHYATPKDHSQEKREKEIEPAEELEHLCNYIVHDNVGVIANAHLVFADKDKNGIFSENCIRLAKKYAIALDFAKSGKTASRYHKDRVFTYPDFMQKFGERNTYISKKALGVLFRNCKRLEMGLDISNSEITYKLDRDLIYEYWERYKKSAEKTYKYYCRKIEYLMNVYSFSNEGELLAGAIINPPKYYEQRHDLDNLMTMLEYEMQWIFNDLQNMFFHEFGNKPKDNNFTEAMYQKASAWYIVAYSKKKDSSFKFFGLPWAVGDVLIAIKQNKGKIKKNKILNFKSLLEDTIDKRLSHRMSVSLDETRVNVIYENRLEVLDVAEQVLTKWLDTQKDHVLLDDLEKFKQFTNSEFQVVSETLLSCNIQYINQLKKTNSLKKAISPTYYILETLLRLACIKLPLQKTSLHDARQELSLLSWATLIKLACTYNPDYLGIGDTSSGICFLPQENVVSSFKVILFDTNEYSEEFSFKLLQEPNKVIEYLQKASRVKKIDFRYLIDRDKKYVCVFTVMGSRYAIEKLKDLVVHDSFFMWVVKDKKVFATQ